MARPFLPIAGSDAFTRPINEWINIVNNKKCQLDSLLETGRLRNEARVWLEREFYRSAILGPDPADAFPSIAETHVNAGLREIEHRVDAHASRANLTPDFLLAVNNLLRGAAEPWSAPPAERRLAMACDWFSADSFDDLHAIEQAATVYLRLSDIRAFECLNHLTSLVAASLFTMRAGLLPIMIPMESALHAAIGEAKLMNTRPMVELIATSTDAALTDLINFLRKIES